MYLALYFPAWFSPSNLFLFANNTIPTTINKKLDENIANLDDKVEENKEDNKKVIFKFKVVEVFNKIFN